MCIRDRASTGNAAAALSGLCASVGQANVIFVPEKAPAAKICLLYTSDAADERSSVDLGGRRIIKKKKRARHRATKCSALNTRN